jgi:predicted amidohydrolase YtcJ
VMAAASMSVVAADHVYFSDPDVTAVLMDGAQVVATGTRRDIRRWGVQSGAVHDYGDATILTGFVDAHSHPVYGARSARGIDLTEVRDLHALHAHLQRARHELRSGEWILGWGLRHDVWGAEPISSASIDAVVPDAPVLLRLFDAHSAVANRVALHVAGIRTDGSRVAPEGVETDEAGRATGVLQESPVIEQVAKFAPEEPETDVRERFVDTLTQMAASGLTAVHVMDFEDDPAPLLRAIEDDQDLPVRLLFYPWIVPEHSEADWRSIVVRTGAGGRRWRRHGVKAFLDGTIDNGTAWLERSDAFGQSTSSIWADQDRYARMIEFFAAHDVSTATHAIGDQAIRVAAQAIRSSSRSSGRASHRIEHLELMSDEILDLVAASGAIAGMQPMHCTEFTSGDRTDNWSRRLGDDRAALGWRTRSLLDRGAAIALGSDWPVAPFEPLMVIASAILRRSPEHGLKLPNNYAEALTLDQAIEAYTKPGVSTETPAGILPGDVADLTIVAGDLRSVGAGGLAATPVLGTIIDGRPVH